MLRMSKKVEYAIIAMVDMADRNEVELVTTKEIAKLYNIPPQILGKVLQALSKKGLIESIQGVRGGYRANKMWNKITIASIIETIDGPIDLLPCSCDQLSVCNIKTPMKILQDELREFFRGITLYDIKQSCV